MESNDSYDMEDFAMPLQEYINHAVAWDIVHNGATFQVLHRVFLYQCRDSHASSISVNAMFYCLWKSKTN